MRFASGIPPGKMEAAGDFNPTRFIAGFQRVTPLPPFVTAFDAARPALVQTILAGACAGADAQARRSVR